MLSTRLFDLIVLKNSTTRNECFLYLSFGGTELLSEGLSDQYDSFLYTDFFIFSMVA